MKRDYFLLLILMLGVSNAMAGGSLNIPTTINNHPTNVGLLVIGHSTSQVGDYPAKLAQALNLNANGMDGRNYVVFKGATGGDGGFLWSRLSLLPSDIQYNRIQASTTVDPASTATPQWCQDGTGTRWSCRRAKVEEILRGSNPLPNTGTCSDASIKNACTLGGTWTTSPTMQCTYYDNSGVKRTEALSFNACWQKMDYKLALVQDTSNRSWPIDDYNKDGQVNVQDTWPAANFSPAVLPCGAYPGEVNGAVDWNCDNQPPSSSDSVTAVSAGWLENFSLALLNNYGANSVQHVFFMQKPVEMGRCNLYPNEPFCSNHGIRSPSTGARPNPPLDHYYLPTVYWEYRSIEMLFSKSGLDSRLHKATVDVKALWNRSAKCYKDGLVAGDWRIPANAEVFYPYPTPYTSKRPVTVAADDSENDADPTSSGTVGCMLEDHVHHNDNGGWMIADVWYSGLLPYLQ